MLSQDLQVQGCHKGPHTYTYSRISLLTPHTLRKISQSPWIWADPQNRFLNGAGCQLSWPPPRLLEYGILFHLNMPTTRCSPPSRQPVLLLGYPVFKNVSPPPCIYAHYFWGCLSAPYRRQISARNTQTPHTPSRLLHAVLNRARLSVPVCPGQLKAQCGRHPPRYVHYTPNNVT